MGGIYRGIADGHSWTEDLVSEGDRVAARWTVEGTHGGELLGLVATGRRFRFGGLSIYRLADGKIAEQWEQFDRLGLLEKLSNVVDRAGVAVCRHTDTPKNSK